MKKKNNDNVFISFSGRRAEEVAKHIKNTIELIYPPGKINTFFSRDGMIGGRFQKQIIDAAKNAKASISILSEENKREPWLMYEAGALSLSAEGNGGVLIPYLFCRDNDDIESPLSGLQYYQYQRNSSNNPENFINMFIGLEAYLSESIGRLEITRKIKNYWADTIEERFLEIENSNAFNEDKAARSRNINLISIDSLETTHQNNILLSDVFSPETPKNIEEKLDFIVKNYIPEEWKKMSDIERKYNSTRIVVNQTRFSTFVVFTDGNRIALFDRGKDRKNTNVENDRFDVFGSVQFENRTIKNKIKNPEFFDSKILKVEGIHGVAIEDNKSKRTNERETAVMVGVCIYLSQKDLDKSKEGVENKEIELFQITSLPLLESKLTSKANLSVSHLIKSNFISSED